MSVAEPESDPPSLLSSDSHTRHRVSQPWHDRHVGLGVLLGGVRVRGGAILCIVGGSMALVASPCQVTGAPGAPGVTTQYLPGRCPLASRRKHHPRREPRMYQKLWLGFQVLP